MTARPVQPEYRAPISPVKRARILAEQAAAFTGHDRIRHADGGQDDRSDAERLGRHGRQERRSRRPETMWWPTGRRNNRQREDLAPRTGSGDGQGGCDAAQGKGRSQACGQQPRADAGVRLFRPNRPGLDDLKRMLGHRPEARAGAEGQGCRELGADCSLERGGHGKVDAELGLETG